MAVHLLITLTTDFLEHQNLVTFEVFQHGGLYVSTSNIRLSNLHIAVIVFKHHGVKRHFATLVVLQTVDENLLILGDLELLTCDFYDCVQFLIVCFLITFTHL